MLTVAVFIGLFIFFMYACKSVIFLTLVEIAFRIIAGVSKKNETPIYFKPDVPIKTWDLFPNIHLNTKGFNEQRICNTLHAIKIIQSKNMWHALNFASTNLVSVPRMHLAPCPCLQSFIWATLVHSFFNLSRWFRFGRKNLDAEWHHSQCSIKLSLLRWMISL